MNRPAIAMLYVKPSPTLTTLGTVVNVLSAAMTCPVYTTPAWVKVTEPESASCVTTVGLFSTEIVPQVFSARLTTVA